MSDLLRLAANEDLLKAKKLLMLITGLNAALWGSASAIAAATGHYTVFVAGLLLALLNGVLLAHSYQKWSTIR